MFYPREIVISLAYGISFSIILISIIWLLLAVEVGVDGAGVINMFGNWVLGVLFY